MFVFDGYQGRALAVPQAWQQAACCLLKLVHLIKSIEEDSQDIDDYAEPGFFPEARGIGFSVPIHRAGLTNEILIPGATPYESSDELCQKSEQHTLGVELRISDVESWRTSEQTGESHRDADKSRQLVSVMNRVFKKMFDLPAERFDQLRRDQEALLSCRRPHWINHCMHGAGRVREIGLAIRESPDVPPGLRRTPA